MRNNGIAIGRRIGEGSYSKVYMAQVNRRTPNGHGRSVRKIACKIIDGRRTSSDYINRFFPRELKIMHRLSHPHIVSVFKMLEIGPYICCLMNLCSYGDLLQRIQLSGSLHIREAKLFFCQIVAAIHYLHNLGICHRDVKCENILIHNRYCVKLSDFGFARRFHKRSNGESMSVILSDTFCGSIAYASPEVLKGIPYDPQLYDVWSLGCVLYTMTTGSMPFNEHNVAAMIRYQNAHNIQYPVGVVLEKSLKSLIHSLLDPDVTKRMSIAKLLHDPWLQI